MGTASGRDFLLESCGFSGREGIRRVGALFFFDARGESSPDLTNLDGMGVQEFDALVRSSVRAGGGGVRFEPPLPEKSRRRCRFLG